MKKTLLASILLTTSLNVSAIECTDYVLSITNGQNSPFYQLRSFHAKGWYESDNEAISRGYKIVTGAPIRGDIIVVGPQPGKKEGDATYYGHVMYVMETTSYTNIENYTVKVKHANRYGKGNIQDGNGYGETITISNNIYSTNNAPVERIIRANNKVISHDTLLYKTIPNNSEKEITFKIKNQGTENIYIHEYKLKPINSHAGIFDIEADFHRYGYCPPILSPGQELTISAHVKVTNTYNGTYVPKWTFENKTSGQRIGIMDAKITVN